MTDTPAPVARTVHLRYMGPCKPAYRPVTAAVPTHHNVIRDTPVSRRQPVERKD